MVETPFDQITALLSSKISGELIQKLPKKWEKLGTVLIMKLHPDLKSYKTIIGETYASVLECTTVLQDIGGITGVYRKPLVKIIYGEKNTETVHVENGIRYKLDPQTIMFSSGNMAERNSMAKIVKRNEIVVDLFAGIGYFTLPIAVFCQPKKIYACEINKDAYAYLCQNIVLNDVTKSVEPLLGDNRTTAPKNIADRVIMGYIRDTHAFLPTAIHCLHKKTGVIHYHEVCPNELIPKRPLQRVEDAAMQQHKQVTLLACRKVKTYAPGVSHVVLECAVGEP